MRKILFFAGAIFLAIVLSVILTENVSAQLLGCCLQTNDGDFCVNRVTKNACHEGFFYTGKSCNTVQQCQPITCIPTEGPCQANKILLQCREAGGRYDTREIEEVEECQIGGCNIANIICEVTQKKVCEENALNSGFTIEQVTFSPGMSELEIRQQCTSGGRGTCDLGGGDCEYISSAECASKSGRFIAGVYPSEVSACAARDAQARKGCGILPGDENKIFWFNEYGQQESLVEDCNYPQAFCTEEEIDGELTAYCKSTTCKFTLEEEDSEGREGEYTLLSGTSMCYNWYEDLLGKSTGLQHQILHCVLGDIKVEGLGPDRNKICIDEHSDDKLKDILGLNSNGTIHNAIVEANLWEKCRECGQADGGLFGQLGAAYLSYEYLAPQPYKGEGKKKIFSNKGDFYENILFAGITLLSGNQNRIGDVFQLVPIAIPPGPWINTFLIGSACGGSKSLKKIKFIDDLAEDFGLCKYEKDVLPWGGSGSAIPIIAPGTTQQCMSCGGGGDELWNICDAGECNALGDCETAKAFEVDMVFSAWATTAMALSSFKVMACTLGGWAELGSPLLCWKEFGKTQSKFYDQTIGALLDQFGSPHKKDPESILEPIIDSDNDLNTIKDTIRNNDGLMSQIPEGQQRDDFANAIDRAGNAEALAKALQDAGFRNEDVLKILTPGPKPVATTPAEEVTPPVAPLEAPVAPAAKIPPSGRQMQTEINTPGDQPLGKDGKYNYDLKDTPFLEEFNTIVSGLNNAVSLGFRIKEVTADTTQSQEYPDYYANMELEEEGYNTGNILLEYEQDDSGELQRELVKINDGRYKDGKGYVEVREGFTKVVWRDENGEVFDSKEVETSVVDQLINNPERYIIDKKGNIVPRLSVEVTLPEGEEAVPFVEAPTKIEAAGSVIRDFFSTRFEGVSAKIILCGDNECQITETCYDCPGDCGSCPAEGPSTKVEVYTPPVVDATKTIAKNIAESLPQPDQVVIERNEAAENPKTPHLNEKAEDVEHSWYGLSKAILLGLAMTQFDGPEAGMTCRAETSLIEKGTELCNTCESEDGYRICTKERCEILGLCQAVEKQDGTGYNCVAAPCDLPEGQRAPEIKKIEAEFYLGSNLVKKETGTKTIEVGVIPWNITEVKLTVQTDIGANCRFSTTPQEAWEDSVEFDNAQEFPKEQEVHLTAGGAERTHQIFIKCQNICGVAHAAEDDTNYVRYEKGKVPDFLPPQITKIDPENVYVPEEPSIVTTEIHLSENGMCFFSRDLAELNVTEMQEMDCRQNQYCILSGQEKCGICEIDTDVSQGEIFDLTEFLELPGVEDTDLDDIAQENGLEETKISRFNFVCQDLDGNRGGFNSYMLATVRPLNVTITEPEVGFETYDTEAMLKVEVNHVAICKYSLNTQKSYDDMEDFAEEGGDLVIEHEKLLTELGVGTHTVYVTCEDFATQQASAQRAFTIKVDRTIPIVIRAYQDGGMLKIITNEETTCRYSLEGMSFEFDEGMEMPHDDNMEHIADWGHGVYYIKCRDFFNNELAFVVQPEEE